MEKVAADYQIIPAGDRDQKHDHGKVRIVRHVAIPMKDGTRLSARLWLPNSGLQSTPAIFEFIPYRKSDMVHERDARNHLFFAQHGYACVRVDMRGSGDSEGVMRDMYESDELADAATVIEWIAAQSWCDGKVGMMGTSWGGTASLQAAWSAPEALKAVIAVCATHDRYENDIHYAGGCILTDTLEWGATLPAILAAPPSTDLPEIDWRALWRERLAKLSFPLRNWLEHSEHDAYWDHGSINSLGGDPDCPVLAVGGWTDRYSTSVLDLVRLSPAKVWGIVGPWGHHYPDVGEPGPAIGFRQEAIAWWDHWLKGTDNGVSKAPRLRLWRREYQVPNERILVGQGQWLALCSPIPASQADGPMVLPCSSPEAAVGQREAPRDPVIGMAVGDTGYFGRVGGQPVDQSEADRRSLLFETRPVDAELTLFGHPKVGITVCSDGKGGQLAVRLVDVPPAGPPVLVGWAVKNLALSHDNRTIVTPLPGESRVIEIELPNICYLLKQGHRLRVAVSSMLWPLVWPSGDDSLVLVTDTELSLSISTLEDADLLDTPSFSMPASSSPVVSPIGEHANLVRTMDFDNDAGTLVTTWHQPYQAVEIRETGLEFGYETRTEHHIRSRDGNSPASSVYHRFFFRKGDWVVDIMSHACMETSGDTLAAKCQVKAIENGRELVSKDWEFSRDAP